VSKCSVYFIKFLHHGAILLDLRVGTFLGEEEEKRKKEVTSCVIIVTSVQSNLAKGRITILSPLAEENAFAACAWQAHSPAAADEHRAMHSCVGA